MPLDPSLHTRLADGFRVGEWTVLPRSNELTRPGETVHVEPTPMQVLTLLAEHAGETVTREELIEAVWPDVFVTENALSRSISQLRKLFGDDARAPRVIETIPTVGYRLIAPVYHLGDGYTPSASSDVALSIPAPDPAVTLSEPVALPIDRGFRLRVGWAWGLLALAAVALGALALLNSVPEPPVESVTRPLTSAPGLETAPVLSPDGSRVAYVHSTDSTRGDLFVQVLGASAPLQLTEGPAGDGSPTWAPDGRTLAFVRCEESCGVFSVSSLGGDVRRLADGLALPWGLSFHPDGQRLALVTADGPGEPTSLSLLDLATGERLRLTTPPATSTGDLFPMVSPDGTTVAFTRRTSGGGQDLFLVPVEGGEPERLTFDSRDFAGHGWTPDGDALLFSSNRTGMYELWRVPASGGDVTRVSGIVARDPGRPVAAPGRLVFEEWAFEINVWEAAADEAEPRQCVVSTWWDKQPHLRADGSRIAFISNRSGPPEVWTADHDGANPTRLTDFGGASVEAPRWSPDGTQIVFQARPETQADLYVIGAESGTPRRLTPSEADEVMPRWSQDGRSIYFGSNRDGTWQLWKMPAEGGEAVRVTDEGGITGEESADGERVLYTKPGVPGLWAQPVEGGVERLVTDALPVDMRGSWSITEEGVLVVTRSSAGFSLQRIDEATGEAASLPVRLGRIMSGEPGLTATANGQRILFAQVDRVESDLMDVEPFE